MYSITNCKLFLFSYQVAVTIGDINDHRPEFSEDVYEATINENAAANERVIQLMVTDGDRTKRNRHFIFKIRGSVDPRSATQFRITSEGTHISVLIFFCAIIFSLFC